MGSDRDMLLLDGRPWLGANFWSRTGGPLMWRSYDGGGVGPSEPDPRLSRVSHTGKHRIPILYERETVAAPPIVPV